MKCSRLLDSADGKRVVAESGKTPHSARCCGTLRHPEKEGKEERGGEVGEVKLLNQATCMRPGSKREKHVLVEIRANETRITLRICLPLNQ